jgi:hypothetical protein
VALRNGFVSFSSGGVHWITVYRTESSEGWDMRPFILTVRTNTTRVVFIYLGIDSFLLVISVCGRRDPSREYFSAIPDAILLTCPFFSSSTASNQ